MTYLASELTRIAAVDRLRLAAKVCERPIAYLSDYDLAAHLRDIAILIEKQAERTTPDRVGS